MKTLALIVVVVATVANACGSNDFSQLSDAGSLARGAGGPEKPATIRVGIGSFDAMVESTSSARFVTQRGFECGWLVGWQKHVLLARRDDAAAFRTRTMAGATGLGFVTFIIGFAAILLAATVYPRMRRASQMNDSATPPPAPSPADARPAAALARQLGRNGLKRLAKWLHLEQFDPRRADRWGEALATAFEAERQIRCALANVRNLAGHDTEPGREVIERLDTWRSELKRWRLAWEEEPLPPGNIQPEAVIPVFALALRAARDLRMAMTRTETRGDTPDWRTWLSDVRGRPATPDIHSPSGTPPPPWVRRAGWLGLGSVALGLFFTAGWFAAGALPLFFALVFSVGGLAGVTFARLRLRQAGGYRLLPGFADRAARWLVMIAVLSTSLMLVSSWMSAPSGLDLGDPPPIAMPDASAMKAPDLGKLP